MLKSMDEWVFKLFEKNKLKLREFCPSESKNNIKLKGSSKLSSIKLIFTSFFN
jgi:hypothetical protein